jgi:hypothetical protein
MKWKLAIVALALVASCDSAKAPDTSEAPGRIVALENGSLACPPDTLTECAGDSLTIILWTWNDETGECERFSQARACGDESPPGLIFQPRVPKRPSKKTK